MEVRSGGEKMKGPTWSRQSWSWVRRSAIFVGDGEATVRRRGTEDGRSIAGELGGRSWGSSGMLYGRAKERVWLRSVTSNLLYHITDF